MIYNTPSNFIKDDGTLDIQSVTRYVIDEYEADPSRQQIRLPIDSTSLAVLRKSIGVVNNVTPQGGVILPTSSLVNGIVSGYVKSDNYVAGSTGWSIKGDGSAEFNNVTVRGFISATSGTVGGFTINATSLQDIAGMVGLSSAVTAGDDIRFWAGSATPSAAPFSVTEAGVLKATSGTVGGFTLGSTALTAGTGATRIQLDTTTGIHLGATAFADAPFSVTLAGALKSTSGTIGGWTIGATTLAATGITLDSANQKILVGATAPILIDGINKKIASDNYVSGVNGAGFYLDENLFEVGNIRARGLFRTSVFQKDTISTVGGNLMVLDGDILDVDMENVQGVIPTFPYVAYGSIDSGNNTDWSITSTPNPEISMTIKGSTIFNIGDILRIKDGIDDEWMEVVGINSATEYIVTRDLAGSYTIHEYPIWQKGVAVVNYGASGKGGIYMTASDSNAPYLSIFDHAGAPWTTINTRLRIGNLNGYLGYDTDLYGIAIGETNKFLKYDPVNGLRIKGDNAQLDVGISGYLQGGQTDFNTGTGFFLGQSGGDYKFSIGSPTNFLTWDGEYMKLKGSFDVGVGGVINNASYLVADLPVAPSIVGFNSASAFE
jgi:hypothetical protein